MSSADRLVNKIIEDAKREAEEILNEAKSKTLLIEEEARKKANELIEEEVSKFKRMKEGEAKRMVTEARIKAKERLLNEREALISQAIDKAKEELEVFVKSQSYIKSLEYLIEEAAAALGGGDLIVQLNERDAKLWLDFKAIAKRVGEKLGVDVKLELSSTNIKCMGGAIISTRDGSYTYNNTYESRIERQKSLLRLTAAKILFTKG